MNGAEILWTKSCIARVMCVAYAFTGMKHVLASE